MKYVATCSCGETCATNSYMTFEAFILRHEMFGHTVTVLRKGD